MEKSGRSSGRKFFYIYFVFLIGLIFIFFIVVFGSKKDLMYLKFKLYFLKNLSYNISYFEGIG